MSRRDVNCPGVESPQAPQVGSYPSQEFFSPYVVCCSPQHLLDSALSASVWCRDPQAGHCVQMLPRERPVAVSMMVARARC